MQIKHIKTGKIYEVDYQTKLKYVCNDKDSPKYRKFFKKNCTIIDGTGEAPKLVERMKGGIIVVE